MALFRKKPVEVEAVRYDDKLRYNAPHWLVAAFLLSVGAPGRAFVDGSQIIISTLEGDMRADPGDWIICGVQGELYPCKPDIFEATYDAVYETRPAKDNA